MITLEQALNLFYLLSQTLSSNTTGDVVELGCYRGLTAVLLKKTLDIKDSKKNIHLFDSFQGLGEKSSEDTLQSMENVRPCDYHDNKRIKPNWFKSSIEEVEKNFKLFNLELPHIYPGWFSETLEKHLPDKICFVHIDCDFYRGTLQALEKTYPKMSSKGIMVIDDYCDPKIHPKQNSLPGIKIACDHFFKNKEEQVEVLAGGPGFHGMVQIR